MTTIYEHDGKELFKDEQDAYQIEDIRTHYAQFDKRLITATYTVIPAEDGGERRVIFAKKTGTKASNSIIMALLNLPPCQPAAFDLLAWLWDQDQLTAEELLPRAPEIAEACYDLAVLASSGSKAVTNCLELKPAAAPNLPVGF